MAMKLALIVLFACAVQGFNLRSSSRSAEHKCKCDNVPESAEEIPHDFDEAVHDMDEVREEVSIAVVDAYFKGHDPKVVIACFKAQRENYRALGERIHGLVKDGAKEMAEKLGDMYEKYAAKAGEPLKTIAETMRALPEKMWEFIKEKQFGEALKEMKRSKEIVEENARKLHRIVGEIRQELPEAAERAEEIAREIREEARAGSRAIGEAFRTCVKENSGAE